MVKNILMIVEGEKTDTRLMQQLNDLYMEYTNTEIIPYNTNIYTLYHQLFDIYDDDQIDIINVLKENELDKNKKEILNKRFNEIILVFDFDPQDSQYSEDKIRRLMNFFNESTENGRLYLNYPMVESFYHMKAINEPSIVFNQRYIDFDILMNGKYKELVNKESCFSNFNKFTLTTVNGIILRHLNKIKYLLQHDVLCDYHTLYQILNLEIDKLKMDNQIFVLNTCMLYYYEYQPNLFKK